MAPRSHGYGDATATYICRSEIPSRIYAKLQYRQELEAEQNNTSTWLSQKVIQYYRNITSPENIKVQYMKRYTKAERCSRAARGTSRANQEKSCKEELRRRPSFCCTLTTTGGSAARSNQLQQGHHGPSSRIWT